MLPARLRSLCLLFALVPVSTAAAAAQSGLPALDSDHDGLSDALEQRLLTQFAPDFRVGKDDCAALPAMFQPNVAVPLPKAADGTIYGQAFLAKGGDPQHPGVELHFYHLWTRDCGGHGHPLDTEHVAVQVRASEADLQRAHWRATYWYAAAHEDTVCDVSQIARAAALHAETRGATVWISPGKHASYLSEMLCSGGCGADRCERMERLEPARIINLGEVHQPMNEALFISSAQWPLSAKMITSNFSEAAVARLEQLPPEEIALFHAGRHPAQGVIAISAATGNSLAGSGESTTDALALAGDDTSDALATAGDHTGNALATATDHTGSALKKSFRKTRHALGTSAQHVGEATGMVDKTDRTDKTKGTNAPE